MKFILSIVVFINGSTIEQTATFPTLSECLKQQYYQAQLLEKLQDKANLGITVKCTQG
jgi:hypothetical protein